MPKYSRTVQLPGRSASEIYEKVSTDIERFISKMPLGKCEITHDVTTREVRFKASMAKATLLCRDGAIQLDAELSLFAVPFRSKIDEGIDKWVAKTFPF